MKKNNDTNIAEDNKDVCCEKHEHHHEHEDHCGCGHDHHKHEYEAHCSCGHEHHHEHDDRCGCGHDNHHEHEDHCGCGHDNHEHGCGCGCGCEHGEEDEKVLTIRLIAGAILFAAGIVTENVLSSPLISDILFVVAYIVLGYDIVWNAIKNIFKGHLFNENFLMSIASIGAFAVGEHPEAVAVMLFYQVGEALQERAAQKSRNSITELMDIRPDYANTEVNGTITKVSPSEILIGDIIIVKPGEKIPLDGTITSGETYLDTKALTGESVPRKAVTGDTVLSGSLNTGSPIYIKVEKTYGESTISKILDMVEHAQSKKAKSEKFISVFAKYYTPIVVALAVIVMFVPPLFLGDFRTWIYRGLMFLVVSCPCALVVSIPLGFFAGIGCASKNGILVKGSNFIEKLAKLDTVVFDKTGTLTKGVFAVKDVYSVIDKDELIKYAAYAEFYSTHPIAVSVKNAYKNTVDTAKILNYTEISGMGISADIDGHKVLAGNVRLLESNNISHEKAKSYIGSIIYIAVDGKFAGYIVISDEIKADSKVAISALKQLNIKSVMLTGDVKKTPIIPQSRLVLIKFIRSCCHRIRFQNLKKSFLLKILKRMLHSSVTELTTHPYLCVRTSVLLWAVSVRTVQSRRLTLFL